MIPSIRNHIDQANRALENNDGDDDDTQQRVAIPPEEIVELKEFRKREHALRAREEHESRKLELEKAAARKRAKQICEDGAVADENWQRPFGLPDGKACRDVWEHIFERVHDVEDMANLRDTCVLFRDLLETKYKIMRLNEVVLKFGYRFGGLSTLLALRRVYKSTKAAVDDWIKEDRVHFNWNLQAINIGERRDENKWLNKPSLSLPHLHFISFPFIFEVDLRPLQSIVTSLELNNVPTDTFIIRSLQYIEYSRRMSRDDVLALQNLFERVLQLIGSSVRHFEYRPEDSDNLGSYNRLRSWMLLMPNLEELSIWVIGDPVDYANRHALPNQIPLPPFPSCPRLKRFNNSRIGMRAQFVEQIFLANPWITGVRLSIAGLHEDEEEMDAEEVATYQRALGTLQLERFNSEDMNQIPRHQLLRFRFQWPLRYLVLTIQSNFGEAFEPGIPSRSLFSFVNSFSPTLEELTVTWKIRDTDGFLDLPKAKKVLWRLFPGFTSFEFMIPLEKLQYLDIDVVPLPEVNGSLEATETFIESMDLPSLFPAMKLIRSRREIVGQWFQIWKH